MSFRIASIFSLLVVTALVVAACDRELEAPAEGTVAVTTTTYPLTYLTERIGGDRVTVTQLIKPGVEAHDFEPSPSDIRAIGNARLFVFNHPEFESWAVDAADTSIADQGSASMLIVVQTADIEDHDDEHDEHDGHDEHEEDADHDEQDEHDGHDEHEEDADHDEHDEHDGHDEHEEDADHDEHDEAHDEHDEHEEDADHDEHDEHIQFGENHGGQELNMSELSSEGHETHDEEDKHESHDEHDEHAEHDEDEAHDEHDSHDDHDHIDAHVWLNPIEAKEQAERILSALIEADPEGSQDYTRSADALFAELESLDELFENRLRNCQLDTIVVSHLAFGHLAHRYGLEQIGLAGLSAEFESGPSQIAEVIEQINELGIGHIMQEPIVSNRLAETVAAETDVELLSLHPLEVRTLDEVSEGLTYFDIMKSNAESLATALKCG